MAEDVKPPKIEFPCAYPIKVVGHATDDFRDFVVTVMRRHTEDFDEELVDVRASSGGRFLSVRVTITAKGEAHLKAIFEELKASGRIQMVL
jgi:putative lipoic acid-binding regulatory protein